MIFEIHKKVVYIVPLKIFAKQLFNKWKEKFDMLNLNIILIIGILLNIFLH